MKKLMKNEGFTLVELIVVIAILGILAAVAVPAYTGYIDKANEAADTQVVSAMNTAFAAACTENMVDNGDFTSVEANTEAATDGIKVTGISVDMDETKTDVAAADVQDAFARYFDGNEDTVLKYYKSFTYDNGNFTGSPNEPADPQG